MRTICRRSIVREWKTLYDSSLAHIRFCFGRQKKFVDWNFDWPNRRGKFREIGDKSIYVVRHGAETHDGAMNYSRNVQSRGRKLSMQFGVLRERRNHFAADAGDFPRRV